MKIIIDDLKNGAVLALLEEHLQDMYATSPPESVHALDANALRASNVTFFSAWINNELAGCVAIKTLDNENAELKSMRTSHQYRGQGVASELLQHALLFAKTKDRKTVSLETGTQNYFDPARKLYKKYGFVECGPFSDYKLDPNSYFMTLSLTR